MDYIVTFTGPPPYCIPIGWSALAVDPEFVGPFALVGCVVVFELVVVVVVVVVVVLPLSAGAVVVFPPLLGTPGAGGVICVVCAAASSVGFLAGFPR